MKYRLLADFAALFLGRRYNHRVSTNGDHVAVALYEDLLTLNRSAKYVDRISDGTRVVNVSNTRPGIRARRGDGTLGESLPHVTPLVDPAYAVPRDISASVEIGVEVKIICKAMVRQIGRVISDLNKQAGDIRHKGHQPICVAVVGVNFAPYYVSQEGNVEWRTNGVGRYKHPIQEAAEIVRRLQESIAPTYDELIILPFVATNEVPQAFAWQQPTKIENDYGAALVRISQLYEKRI